jgi:hypothetical protein
MKTRLSGCNEIERLGRDEKIEADLTCRLP